MISKTMSEKLIDEINGKVDSKIRIMEICGTHTDAIAKMGIKTLLSPNIELVSGPGCPVCVSDGGYINQCIELLEYPKVTIATFGDMLRVSGSKGNLQEQKSQGKSIEIIYSPEDVIKLCKDHPERECVFVAVGFETTAPIVASVVAMAKNMKINNLFFLTALKRMAPIIKLILENPETKIDGMICPGHVAVITGTEPFKTIVDDFKIPAVICGFEGMDIISGIHILVSQINKERDLKLINHYTSCVDETGNQVAIKLMNQVFKTSDAIWRGIGLVQDSALVLKDEYKQWDATKKWGLKELKVNESPECSCKEILLGIKTPKECPLFGTSCTAEFPQGPCMISGEGVCGIHYKYRSGVDG